MIVRVTLTDRSFDRGVVLESPYDWLPVGTPVTLASDPQDAEDDSLTFGERTVYGELVEIVDTHRDGQAEAVFDVLDARLVEVP
ncbi:hypothetical protein [Deinococcus pimensis]|uniref:hypothetical protein n=1 Tax=Deinococcus pimensis TaxID=309888 RepID=UPI0004860F62|nr:hypothetical protein [Deinococcus pimensis]